MISKPFNYPLEKIYCARCGRQCEPLGHLMYQFLICPVHGEFTIAPVVINIDNNWEIHFKDSQSEMMWETCRMVDESGMSGRATRTGP